MNLKSISLFLFFCGVLIYPSISHAQKIPVTFKVINEKKEPVPFFSIIVSNRMDTLQSFAQVGDSNGIAKLNLKKAEQYNINITAVNYLSVERGISLLNEQTSFTYILEPIGKTLETAVVISKKPLMKMEDDKLIVDPENLIEASTSGYEVIEKTPGLFVDQDGNIYISSMTPASVQINGRDMKMSAADVATMLKSLPPNAIAKIEIIKTPSAKYDASAGGGIVNVVLKKGVKIGMNGSINAGIQQGIYGNQFIGFNLNNNTDKITSNLNF